MSLFTSQIRLNWANRHLRHPLFQWDGVLFSDESGFCLSHVDSRARVWRRQGERLSDCCIYEMDRYGGGSVMVWGGISSNYRTPLHIFHANVNTLEYQNVLRTYVVPFFSSTPRDAHIPAGQQRSPACGSHQYSVSSPAPFECVALASVLAGHVSHRAYLGWIGPKSAFQMWHTHSPTTWTSSCSRVECFATTLLKRKDKINAQTMPSMHNCKGRTLPLLTWNWKVGGTFFWVTLRSCSYDLEIIKHNKSFDMHWIIFVPIFVRKYWKISEI